MESTQQFADYYLNLMANLKNNMNVNDAFDVYIFLKLQLMIVEKTMSEDITELGDELKTVIGEKTIDTKDLNEFEYIQMCDSAKREYEYLQKLKPMLVSLCQHSANYTIQNYLNLSINKYYSLDVSLTDDEKRKFRRFLISEIKKDLNIDLILEI